MLPIPGREMDEALVQASTKAREEALALGIPVSYMIKGRFITEYPDGSRKEVFFDDGVRREVDFVE